MRRCSHVLQTHLQLNTVLKGSRDRMSVTIYGGSSEMMSVPLTFSSSFTALTFFLAVLVVGSEWDLLFLPMVKDFGNCSKKI